MEKAVEVRVQISSQERRRVSIPTRDITGTHTCVAPVVTCCAQVDRAGAQTHCVLRVLFAWCCVHDGGGGLGKWQQHQFARYWDATRRARIVVLTEEEAEERKKLRTVTWKERVGPQDRSVGPCTAEDFACALGLSVGRQISGKRM